MHDILEVEKYGVKSAILAFAIAILHPCSGEKFRFDMKSNNNFDLLISVHSILIYFLFSLEKEIKINFY